MATQATQPTKPVTQNGPTRKPRSSRAPKDETKEQRFVRLANVRVNRLIKVSGAVANLAKKAQYGYTVEQRTKLIDKVLECAKRIQNAFSDQSSPVSEEKLF